MFIVAVLGIGTSIFVLRLLIYHFIIISKSLTTYEHLKKVYKGYKQNPFDIGWKKSCFQLLCIRKKHTYYDFDGIFQLPVESSAAPKSKIHKAATSSTTPTDISTAGQTLIKKIRKINKGPNT